MSPALESQQRATLSIGSGSKLALEAAAETSRTAAEFMATVAASGKMPWSPVGIPLEAEITTGAEIASTFQRF